MKKSLTKFHFMGIGGSGSNAAASLAVDAGFEVSGCNIEETSYLDKIKNKVKNIKIGHSPSHIDKNTILVVSPSILFSNPNHPELLAARKVITWQEFVGKYLMKDKKVIAISGTHGKSTTTAMAGEVFEDSKRDPTVLVGASVARWHGNARSGKSEIFIIEADEFNDNFLYYHPETVVLNNIEFDHPDFFKNYSQVEESFFEFIKGAKNLIINQDSAGIAKLLQKHKLSGVNLYGYSLGEPKFKVEHSLVGRIIKRKPGGTEFRVKGWDESQENLYSTPLAGDYNVANSLGVILLTYIYKLDQAKVAKTLASFSGIGRRLELKYSDKKISIYDDYAHHPTAIRETLNGLRQKYPNKKLFCIAEPHSFSRTKELLKDYKDAFKSADKVIVGPIFKARDSQTYGVSEQSIVEVSGHGNIQGYADLAEMTKEVKKELGNFEVVVIMGAGNSHKWAEEIVNLYKHAKH